MNLYLRKDGRYESRVPNGKKTDEKGRFYMSLLELEPKNSALSVFKAFVNKTNLIDTAP